MNLQTLGRADQCTFHHWFVSPFHLHVTLNILETASLQVLSNFYALYILDLFYLTDRKRITFADKNAKLYKISVTNEMQICDKFFEAVIKSIKKMSKNLDKNT